MLLSHVWRNLPMYDKLLFEYAVTGRKAYSLPKNELSEMELPFTRTKKLQLPTMTELEVVRHFTNLSLKNYGVDQGFYPLGSCTMKYNPKINEELAGFESLLQLHPLQPTNTTQGILQIYYETSQMLSEITGMAEFSFNPFAGAHGELVGLMIIKEYHARNHDDKRTKIIVPTSAHGTNPASATLCGFEIVEVKANDLGMVDVAELLTLLNEEVAGIMLTNPNTVGIFEQDILKISKALHDNGSLLYYDGANLNAIMGIARPYDMGFDIIHLNIHKSFSTPHGGGGPGSGAVGVAPHLVSLLPNPRVVLKHNQYELEYGDSIGAISGFYGNALVVVKAYYYLLTLGKEHLADVAKFATLNANYLKESLKEYYKLPLKNTCMHEVVFDGLVSGKATTLEVAKRLLDYGYHPPTIYFPLLFSQSMMIEPTEVESKETLDAFIETLIKIAQEAETTPELLQTAPHHTPVRRLDEVKAVRQPILKFQDIKA